MDTLTQAPSGTQWTIEAGAHRAVIVEVGGALREYDDVVFGYGENEICPSSAGKVLAPWPNRIRDGRYSYGGGVHQLALSEPAKHNAIHGLVHWARWKLIEQLTDAVTVEHSVVPQPGYPWPLVLRTTWMVRSDGLTAMHSATNTGAEPCPFGLGTHPYLRVPGVAVEDLTLTIPAGSRLLVDGRSLPIGAAKVAGTDFDYAEGRAIGTTELDLAFGDLDRGADGRSAVTLAGPDGHGVRVWADGAFNWWQVFTGDTLAPARQRKSVAIEPMTCPADAFRSGRDLITIEPGETWQASWGIQAL